MPFVFVFQEPFTLFDGQMDTIDITDNGETADVTLNCESKLISLQNARPRRYTRSDQHLTFPEDQTFLEGVALDNNLTFNS